MNGIRTILAVDVMGSDRLEHDGERNFATQLSAYDGQVVRTADADVTVAEFPNSLAAVRYAVQEQRARPALPYPLKALRVAVKHRAGDHHGDELSPGELKDIIDLLNQAESGGICLSRTVYDVVQDSIELPYDAQVELEDWYYACAPLRVNRKNIDVVKDSVVTLSAAALTGDQSLDVTPKQNPVLRALRALF